MSETIQLVLRFAICFAMGSVPFAVLAMAGTGIDIRQVGSGNPGFNNVLRVNKPRAILTLIGDMGKGFAAVWVFLHVWPLQAMSPHTVALGWLYGFAVVLGHCYSPFLKFNGGKGIATSGGVMLCLYSGWALAALIYFTVVRIGSSRLKRREAGAIASITTWIVFSVLMFIFVGPWDGMFAVLMTIFLGARHKKNFRNLISPAAPEERVLCPAERKN